MHYELIPIFIAIALLYSSVGFGGGSSYLAILALFSIEFRMLRVIALLCNIAVVSGSVYLFWKNGHIRWEKILPLVILSVPAAFLGGYLRISERTFFIALGLTLIAAALAIWFRKQSNPEDPKYQKPRIFFKNSALGGGIGFLAGLVGIGGGIFLSPALHLMNWDRAKAISAAAAFFILVNSVAGLFGQFQHMALVDINVKMLFWLLASVIAGGQIGARMGIHVFNPKVVRRMTAVLVLYVGVQLLIRYAF